MHLSNRHSPLRTLVISAFCAVAFGSAPVFATAVYSYTGTPYNPPDCSGTYVAGCSSYHLTGSFSTTLSSNQLENLTSYSMPLSDIAAFSFSDGGGLTLSQLDAIVSTLAITTNGSGNIVWWDVSLSGMNGSSFVDTYSCLPTTCPDALRGGGDSSGTSPINSGSTGFEPSGQVWSGPYVTSVPEGSAGFLAGIGLITLASFSLIRRRRA